MLIIQSFKVNFIEENCYVVSDETKEAVIIDCGAADQKEFQQISDYIKDMNLKPVRLLLTHGHFDHILGCQYVYDAYGLKPEMHTADRFLYENISDQFLSILHKNVSVPMPPAGKPFDDNDEISFGRLKLKVISAPGHTPGSVCFYCENNNALFSGDTIFQHAIGRTDFPYGSQDALQHSLIHKIFQLPKATTIYPGHGPATSVDAELWFHGVEYL